MFVKSRVGVAACGALVFAGVVALLFWKCRYGFAQEDEIFYLASAYRTCLGDAPFVREWGFGPLFSAMIYPFVRQHLAFAGTDGILLHSRYFYTTAAVLVSVLVAWRLSRYDRSAGFAGAVLFMIYAPYNIMALSYNSIAAMSLLLALTAFPVREPGRYVALFASGLCWALSCACCPYLVGLYAILAAYMFSRRLNGGVGGGWRQFAAFSAGAAAMASIHLAYFTAWAPLGEVISSWRNFVDGSGHEVRLLLPWEMLMFCWAFAKSAYTAPVALLGFATIFYKFVVRKPAGLQPARYVVLATAFELLYLVGFALRQGKCFPYLNYATVPISVLGILLLPLLRKDERRVPMVIMCGGVFYSFAVFLTSNTGFYSIAHATSVTMVGAVAAICVLARRLRTSRVSADRVAGNCLWAVLALQFAVMLALRCGLTYREGGLHEQTECIAVGPQAGLHVAPAVAGRYRALLAEFGRIRKYPRGANVYVRSRHEWMSLNGQCNISGFTSMIQKFNDRDKAVLRRFYEEHPEKKPVAVFIDNGRFEWDKAPEDDHAEEWFGRELGMVVVERTENGVWMEKPE